MTIVIGQTLGKYIILEQLGEGGMATVYKARDTRLDRFVAIKVIRTGSELSEQFRKRFEREAQALARLTHPNIVGIIDYGEQDDIPFLVMEFIPSGTLKQHMKGKMPWQEAVQLLLPVAKALDYAHQHDIIHRDIKPANILITESGEPMLSDFGVAHILEADTTGGLTVTGMAVGTPEYMAPEQLLAVPGIDEESEQTNILKDVSRAGRVKLPRKVVDGRVDEYALGVVLFELISGRKPYMAETPIAVAVKQATEPLPMPSKLVPDLPESVELVLLKVLAKNPDDRYPNMTEFTEAMGKLLQLRSGKGEQGRKKVKDAGPASSLFTPGQTPLPVKRKPKWIWLVASAVLLVLIVAGGVLWMWSTNRGPFASESAQTVQSTEPVAAEATPTRTRTQTRTPAHTFTPRVLTPTLEPGAMRTREQDGMIELYVPAGEFLMGSDDTESYALADVSPQHTVTLDTFWIDQHEVTNAQYALCVAANACSQPHSFGASYARTSYYGDSIYNDFPVVTITWDQAQAYCEWVDGSLPTEAQWEKAARGTDGLLYPWGNEGNGERGNFSWRNNDTVKVCSYPDGNSPYGLCDMAGNVWEWVRDWYDADYYQGNPSNNPTGPSSGTVHSLRGGSWNSGWTYVTAPARYFNNYDWVWDYGFRCVRVP